MTCNMDDPLDFPSKTIIVDGEEVIEYIIPDDQKEQVYKDLSPFGTDDLRMNERFLDLHSGKHFSLHEFRVLRWDNQNWIVSPYYEDGHGTIIDFMPVYQGDR